MTLATLGTISILVLFALCLTTIALAISGAWWWSERLVEASVQGVYGQAAAAIFSSSLMVYAFLADDFSIQYVQHNSDVAMPLFYKITAFWGSLEGSLLFWVLLLSVFSAIAVRVNRWRHRILIPHVVWILSAVNLFFIGLLVFLKNPFEPFLLDMPPLGRGMNPLLQNAYMVVHPPSLYLGYVSLAVPFAFGVAALITGQLDSAWQASVRRWTLFSWLFLSVGLVLGGLWAYEELGWGGYWAWDPVENAGLLPWFTATAFLHSVMIQERRGMMRRWNVILVIISFFLSIVGTFMTRSGVVQSVHAFGKDPQLAWTFGVFMIVIAVGCTGLVIWRWRMMRSRADLESVLSREFAFLLNNWALLVMAFFVLGSTLWPTFTEWFGERVTIRPTHFNHYMVPAGLALLLLMGVGPLLAWRRTSAESLQRQFLIPLLAGTAGTLLAIFFEIRRMRFDAAIPGVDEVAQLSAADIGQALMNDVWGLSCFGLCAFTAMTVTQEFYRGVAAMRRVKPDPDGDPRKAESRPTILDALIRLFLKARRRYGGYVVHLGVVLMFFGWAGNSYKIERKANMRPGDTIQLRQYTLRHAGLHATEDWQKEMITADIEVLRGDKLLTTLRPARWWYFQLPEQPTTEVARHMSIGEDVYVSMQTVDMTTGWTQMRLFVNPLVNWIWVGTVIMLLGGLICIGTRKRDEGHGP